MLIRFLAFVLSVAAVLNPGQLRAQQLPTSLISAAYSADTFVTTRDGTKIETKINFDHGKIRSDTTMRGREVISIVRPDDQKIYTVMVAQKMVMEMPFNKSRAARQMAVVSTPQGKIDLIGPDTAEGVACLKYRITGEKAEHVTYLWQSVANQAPVKMASEDGAFSIVWKNYQAGPQDDSLFQPPAGYQVMDIPTMGGMQGMVPPGAGQ